MTRHTSFHRRVDDAIARREQEPSCPKCGGRWWQRGRRIWHQFDCEDNPTFGRRPADRVRSKPKPRNAEWTWEDPENPYWT